MKESFVAIKALAPISDSEWQGFQGCESFADGSRPMLAEAGDAAIVIADKNGVFFDDAIWDKHYYINMPNMAKKAILAVAAAFVQEYADAYWEIRLAPTETIFSDDEIERLFGIVKSFGFEEC